MAGSRCAKQNPDKNTDSQGVPIQVKLLRKEPLLFDKRRNFRLEFSSISTPYGDVWNRRLYGKETIGKLFPFLKPCSYPSEGTRLAFLKENLFLAASSKIFPLNLLDLRERKKLAKLHPTERLRCNRVWLAIEDCLLASSQDLTNSERGLLIKSMWKSLFATAIYSQAEATKLWKSFALWARVTALRSETRQAFLSECRQWDCPVVKPDLPLPKVPFVSNLGKFFPNWWFTRVIRDGVSSKSDMTLLSHLISTRGLPPPTQKVADRAMEKWEHTLTSSFQPSNDITVQTAYTLGLVMRSRWQSALRKESYTSAMHVSMSNTGSLDCPRSLGGRAKEVSQRLREFLNQKRNLSFIFFDDKEYNISSDRKVGCQLFCDLEDGELGSVEPGDGALFTGRKGYGTCTGSQIFVLALLTGISDGYLIADYSTTKTNLGGTVPVIDFRTIKVLRPPPIRASSVPEPGGKSRIVSVAPWWLTVVLQPFGHGLKSYCSKVGTASAGLHAAYQGYEFAKAVARMSPDMWNDDFCIKQSDLETATDFVNQEKAYAAVSGFLGDLSKDPYTAFATRLLLSPRTIVSPTGEAKVTVRGALMGDPGTKGVLTVLSTISAIYAEAAYISRKEGRDLQDLLNNDFLLQGRRVREFIFANAGDDLTGLGPAPLLRLISKGQAGMDLVVSIEKDSISKIGAFYCEEPLYIKVKNPYGAVLSNSTYNDHIHVDALKMRLISPETKLSDNRDESNPVFGKAGMLAKKLAWSFPISNVNVEEFSDWILRRFVYRFQKFLSGDLREFLPAPLGGIGLFSKRYSLDALTRILSSCSIEHLNVIYGLLSEPSLFKDVKRILSRVASNRFSRGYRFEELKLSEIALLYYEMGGWDRTTEEFDWWPTGGLDTEPRFSPSGEILFPVISLKKIQQIIPMKEGERYYFYTERLRREFNILTEGELNKLHEDVNMMRCLLITNVSGEQPLFKDFQTVTFNNRYEALEDDLRQFFENNLTCKGKQELDRDVIQPKIIDLLRNSDLENLQNREFQGTWFFNMNYPVWGHGSELSRLQLGQLSPTGQDNQTI